MSDQGDEIEKLRRERDLAVKAFWLIAYSDGSNGWFNRWKEDVDLREFMSREQLLLFRLHNEGSEA